MPNNNSKNINSVRRCFPCRLVTPVISRAYTVNENINQSIKGIIFDRTAEPMEGGGSFASNKREGSSPDLYTR